MIARYSQPEMTKIWSDAYRYLMWLEVETAVCEQLVREKVIPRKQWKELQSKLQQVRKSGGVDPKRVLQLERVVKHDVIAFTTALAERVGPTSRYVHFGLTSSDVVDTAFSLQIQEAGRILVSDIHSLLKTLKRSATQYRKLPTIGRSHGIFAEPTSFGLKFLGWHAEWKRNLERLEEALEQLRVGKLSGAVGVGAHFGIEFEEKVLRRLQLNREPVSTQVIPRDRHAQLMFVFALCGGSLERIAIELRHLQRSEVAEVIEGFSKGQKGSSAMPHKRNPISSENITGCARLLRGYASTAAENIALWHERDISHSSVERVIFPDSTQILCYAIRRMRSVLENLHVDQKQVEKNLNLAGQTVYSGHFLLELVRVGVSREQAYAWVQQCALESLEGKGKFLDLIAKHSEIKKVLPQAKALGGIKNQLKNVSEIYRKALR